MTKALEKLYTLLNTNLLLKAPVFSGNTKDSIKITNIGERSVEIVIDPKYYDLGEWKKNKRLVFSMFDSTGSLSYADVVNQFGGFGSGNSSMHWVNRACYESANVIANEIGAVLDNKLPL